VRPAIRRAVRIGVVALLWAPIFVVVAHVASGVGPADLPGFSMGTAATASRWFFESPSLGIPAQPTGELDVAHAETTLKSGPAGYGLGSVMWPGQVAAALPSFLQGEIESQSNGQFQSPFGFPNYPVRAESFYPQGPTSANTQAGTVFMTSDAAADRADASSSLNSFGFPGIGGAGSQSSLSSNGFDNDGAVSMARAEADDISFAAGLVQIDSVISAVTARSDGERGTVAGATTVSGATVGGHPVTIDSSGVHAEDQGTGTAAQQQVINALLKNGGMSMATGETKDDVSGPSASRLLPGLRVTMEDSTADKLISALPAALQSQIRAQVTPDQAYTVTFATASARTTAAKGFELPPIDTTVGGVSIPTTGGTGASVAEPSSGGPGDLSGGGSSGPVSGSLPSSGSTLAAAPASATSHAVPIAMMVGLTLIALATSRPLVAAADRILFRRGGASGCPDGKDI
jgi:hypothetical protein